MSDLKIQSGYPSVLVLDDQDDVATTIANLVGSLGGVARTSESAESFFCQWEKDPPDVSIIDLKMPQRDGLDVLRELGSRSNAQVILVSGLDLSVLGAARQAAQASGLHVLGVLTKPVRRSELAKLLSAARSGLKIGNTNKSTVAPHDVSIEALTDALKHGRIVPYFQPKICLRDQTLNGFEALARWQQPDGSIIPPTSFIPLLTTAGLDLEFIETILQKSLSFLGSLGNSNLTMAINVPMHVCSDAGFARTLQNVLSEYHVENDRIVIELTEAGPSEILQPQIDMLTRLRMDGFKLSIDDFGTGVSSLERLVRIPFNELKIDRQFARDICQEPRVQQLVRHLVGIARSMEMSTTIEGVENSATLELAASLGCEFAQGYHIAKPMPASDAREWSLKRLIGA